MELNTNVKAATVFSNHARVERYGQIILGAGIHIIEVNNLPLAIDVNSVWAKASGKIHSKILGVDVKKEYLKKTPKGKSRELLNKIMKIEGQIQVYTDEAETYVKQINHLDGVAEAKDSYAKSISKGKFTPENHKEFIDFFMKNRISAKNNLREKQLQKKKLEIELKKLNKELKDIESSKPLERYSVIIECETSEKGELNFEIIYNIYNASWVPSYDVRLTDKILETTYLGQITQKTGEDWSNISLTLSTAPPSSGNVIPKLNPWFISQKNIEQYAGNSFGSSIHAVAAAPLIGDDMAISESEMLSELSEESEPVGSEYQTAGIKTDGTFVVYNVNDNIDVPGDGTLKKAVISFVEFEPELDYVTTPILDDAVYRRIKIKNNSSLTFLPGQAQLFENENYIGNGFIQLTSPQEKIKLYFGKDNRIRISRKLTSEETDKKFIGDKKRIHYEYKIKIQSYIDGNQKIIIRDHIPISKHEKIKVKLENIDPEPHRTDKLNRFEWVVDAEINKEYNVCYEFIIEFPADMKINGLP